MSHPQPLRTARCAADCRDWLTPEDVMRHALAAFYATCQADDTWERQNGIEDFELPLIADNGRPRFAQDLAERFWQRLNNAGLDLELPEFARFNRDVRHELEGWPVEVIGATP